jgi:hypothetical protein
MHPLHLPNYASAGQNASTLSQSGKISFWIILPKVIPLSMWICITRLANPKNFLHNIAVIYRCVAQIGPIASLPPLNYIVDYG